MGKTETIILGVALMFTMWGMGLSLALEDFKRVLQKPKAVALGLVNQLILLPLIGYALLLAFPTSPEVAVGIMILAACPGGPTSNLMSLLAKADTALSVTLTAITSLVTIITIPFIVNFGLEQFAGEGQTIQLPILETIGKMVAVMIVPMALGMFIKSKNEDFAKKMDRPVRIISVVLLAIIIIGLIISKKDVISSYFVQAGVLALLLNVVTMLIGFASARLFSLSTKQSTTISLETGIQNGTLALAVAITLLNNEAYGIAPAVYSLLMYLSGGILVSLVLKKNK